MWLSVFRVLCVLAGSYLLVVLVIKCFETTLIHMPSGPDNWSTKPDGVEDVTIATADGNVIHAWWLPPTETGLNTVLLYAHGKGGNLSHRGAMMVEFQKQLGCGVLQFDYPGYGRSTGWPTEQACHTATNAAFAWLIAQKGYEPGDVMLFGESLGGGVAAELAAKQPVKGLILCCTYTSMPDAAAHRFPWLPCHLVMSARFPTERTLPRVSCPVLVIHGTADDRIPYWQGERLYSAANEPKRFVRLDGAGHCQWSTPDTWRELREMMR